MCGVGRELLPRDRGRDGTAFPGEGEEANGSINRVMYDVNQHSFQVRKPVH